MEDICSAPPSFTYALFLEGWAIVMLLVFALGVPVRPMRYSRNPMGPTGRRLWTAGLLIFVAVGGRALWTAVASAPFRAVKLTPAGLMLVHAWPRADVALLPSSVESVEVVRGRRFDGAKRIRDRAWLKVSAETSLYSCEDVDVVRVGAAGKELAAAVGKPLRWLEVCPPPGSLGVPSDEASVSGPGAMAVPAACTSVR